MRCYLINITFTLTKWLNIIIMIIIIIKEKNKIRIDR